MKKIVKRISVVLGAAAMAACFAFAGCAGTSENFVDGPEYSYRVTDKTDEYILHTSGSSVVVDPGINIDGVFDESFYSGRNWLKANKILEQSGQTETGTLEMTTYFSETGIVIAAHIVDSRAAVYSSSVATGNQTCFSGYFAFGDATTTGDDVYEIENTAANVFKISEFVSGGLQVMYTAEDVTPVHAVRRVGDITKGECYEYYVEYFMPYALFGRSECTSTVYFNPTMTPPRSTNTAVPLRICAHGITSAANKALSTAGASRIRGMYSTATDLSPTTLRSRKRRAAPSPKSGGTTGRSRATSLT